MDAETAFVRPADISATQFDMGPKASTHMPTTRTWDGDERFMRYDSSPESIVSCGDERSFSFSPSPISNDSSMGGKHLLDMIRQAVYPYQDQIDSMTTFPFLLTPLEESLVSTYLTDYSETTYCFNPGLRPHPMAVTVSMSMSMSSPASFHLILALSAQYRLSWSNFISTNQQRELEVAMMKHKGEAIQMIRNLSSQPAQGKQTEDLMASIIALGMLDQHTDGTNAASMHFGASRQLLKSIGGPLNLQSVWLSRVLAHFECGYGATTQSYVWDRSDFVHLNTELNQFFSKIWSIQRASTSGQSPSRRGSADSFTSVSTTTSLSPQPLQQKQQQQQYQFPLGLKPSTLLHDILTRKSTSNPSNPTHQDRLDLISQLNSLLTLCTVLLDFHSDPYVVQAYIDSVHDLVSVSQSGGQRFNSNNITWLLQVHDHSDMHSARIWAVTGWIWILRHVSFNVQSMVRDWLVAVLTGKSVTRALKLDSFAFSYAS